MTGNKIFGIILLVLGLLIILWGLYSSYNIFKGNAVLPQVFRSDEIELQKDTTKISSPEDIQKEMEQAVEEQIAKIIPQGTIFKLLNLIAWSIFAWILIMGGGKIASLGIKLLK